MQNEVQPRRSRSRRNRARVLPFCTWAMERLESMLAEGDERSIEADVQNIIRGPSLWATSYTHMYESGRHFRTWATDDMKKTTANSYIYQSTMNGTREKPYACTIFDILEADFGSFNSIVLEVRWHKSIMSPPKRATMVM